MQGPTADCDFNLAALHPAYPIKCRTSTQRTQAPKVTHATIFSTYIRADDGLVKIVPNDNIWKNVIVNQTTGVVKAPPSDEAKPPEGKADAA